MGAVLGVSPVMGSVTLRIRARYSTPALSSTTSKPARYKRPSTSTRCIVLFLPLVTRKYSQPVVFSLGLTRCHT